MAKSASTKKSSGSANPNNIDKVTNIVATVVQYPYVNEYHGKSQHFTDSKPLKIISAKYYDPGNKSVACVDLASSLNGLISGNKLSFIVDEVGMGCLDPAYGVIKELELIYTYNEVTSTIICKQRDTVVLLCY